jgi:hypothetical protein
MNRFIYVIKIPLTERMHSTQLRVPPHTVFCWIAHNRTFQPLVPVTSTHPSTQLAAVTTQSGLMIEPPHMGLPPYSNDN